MTAPRGPSGGPPRGGPGNGGPGGPEKEEPGRPGAGDGGAPIPKASAVGPSAGGSPAGEGSSGKSSAGGASSAGESPGGPSPGPASPGVLYGIGVGPGDPGLLTIKAARILSEVDEIFTASSSANEDSLAARIVAPHLRPGVPIRKLGFPMTADQAVLEDAWDLNARQVAGSLRAGRAAAFLTLGDCLTYSTYAYLLAHLRRVMPEARIESVPGVASYQLAAARLNRPLVMGRESLAVLGGPAEGPGEEALLAAADNLAILKSYRDTPATMDKLKAMGLADRTALCANLALPGETIVDGIGNLDAPPGSYFTLMLVNKRPRD